LRCQDHHPADACAGPLEAGGDGRRSEAITTAMSNEAARMITRMIGRTMGAALALSTCILAQAPLVSQNIGTGQQPMAVAVNETTNRAYVVNHNDSSVAVVDGKTRTVIATIKTGTGPESVAVNPLTNKVYVVNATESSVT